MENTFHPPNIVFITTDTQGREMISAYGKRPGVDTPQIDRLARRGILFQNAFTTCPLCTPARSSWYTGLYPNRNGAWMNDVGVRRSVPMLAEMLTFHGYDAYHIGKWHLDGAGYTGGGRGDGGFDAGAWYDLHNFYTEVGKEGINQFGGWNQGLADVKYCFGHRVASRAIDLLQSKAESRKPFFLSVSFDEPHGPYICPPPFRGRFSQAEVYRPPTISASLQGKPRIQQDYAAFLARHRTGDDALPSYYHRYYDCNSYVDDEIGRVVDAVDRYCSANTVIIYTSDHGDHLGAFGLCAKGPTMYDHTIAVPLIMSPTRDMAAPSTDMAAHWAAGSRQESCLVSSVDVWATIVDLAGVPTGKWGISPENGYAGRSLVPLLAGQTAAVRDEVFVEYGRFGKKFTQANGFFPIRCIRTPDWKLSINLFDTDELYDLKQDPREAHNLIDHPALQPVRVGLHDRLLAWQDANQDLFRSPAWGRRPWRPDYIYQFEGLFTTGYRDRWEFGAFS